MLESYSSRIKGRLVSMKTRNVVILLLSLISLCFTACDNDTPVVSAVQYATPTARGSIVLPEGSGLSFSDIYLRVEETGTQYRVGTDGSWVVSGLEENKSYTLFFSDEPFTDMGSRSAGDGHHHYGGRKNNVQASVGEGTDNGLVQIKRTASVTGTVSFADGTSSALGVDVFVPGTSFIAKCAEDGSFTITGLPDGKYRIVVQYYGYIPVYSQEFTVLTSESDETVITIDSSLVLVPGTGTVQGSVVYAGSMSSVSTPASVYFENVEDAAKNATTMSNESGNFSVTGLAPGVYTVIVTPTGSYTTAKVENVSVDAGRTTVIEPIVLTANGGSFRGAVSTYDGKSPTGATVLLTSMAGTESYYTGTDSTGSFQITGIVPGSYTYMITLDGYAPLTGTAVISAATVFETAVTLQAGSGAVSGKVFLSGSTVHSGVTVTIVDISNSNNSYTATTLEDGSYSILGIKSAGSYQVRASMAGYVSDNSQTVQVRIGQTSSAPDISLSDIKGIVRGTVSLEGAASDEGVMLLLKGDSGSYMGTTAQDGSFAISGVVPGTYTLLASRTGYVSFTTLPFSIGPNGDVTVDAIALQIGVRSIAGKLTLELSGGDESGALVTATNLEDTSLVYSAITNSIGSFSLAGLKPGQYMITISKSGYNTVTLPTADVRDGQVLDLDAGHITIARGEIEGIAKLEGWDHYEGIVVELVGTDEVTTTDEDGFYSFSVPSGNYPGGLRFSKDDFELTSRSGTITVLANSTNGIEDVQLKALRSSVSGRVDVRNTEDESNVRISLSGTSYSLVTSADGAFRFDHVPLGSYTLVLERENTPVVTQDFSLTPCELLDLGAITLTPNSAVILGTATLNGMSSHAGINVTVTPEDPNVAVLTALTDAGGFFRIPNVISTGSYTVTFSKAGWVSQSMKVTGLQPLEEKDITPSSPIILVDTTAPELSRVTINSGANTTASPDVTITLAASDEGSGIEKMQYCFDNRFDETVTMRDYTSSFSVRLPDNNGEKTIYVKVYDGSGNGSDVISATVTLTDQYTRVGGVLDSNSLHWTVTGSPYLVEQSVMVMDGSELIIDPGVDVVFAGPFYIHVDGKITANGTEAKPIKFYGVDEGVDTWTGIFCSNNDMESTLSYIDIKDAQEGLGGYLIVDNASIEASSIALGHSNFNNLNFQGVLYNSDIYGTASVDSSILDNVRFYGDVGIVNSTVNNTLFEGDVNNASGSYFTYSTFKRSIGNVHPGNISGSVFVYCSFDACPEFKFYDIDIHNSNLINCNKLCTKSPKSSYEILDFTGNYWGPDHTRELDENKDVENYNASFIEDFYDGNYNLSKIDWSDYRSEKIDDVGYHGDGFRAPVKPSYQVGDFGPGGGIVFYVDEDNKFDWNYIEGFICNVGKSFGYYRESASGENKLVGATGDAVGTGKANTDLLVKTLGCVC